MSTNVATFLKDVNPERLAPGARSVILTEQASPKMATPGHAFWGGMTLVAAAEEIGRWYG